VDVFVKLMNELNVMNYVLRKFLLSYMHVLIKLVMNVDVDDRVDT